MEEITGNVGPDRAEKVMRVSRGCGPDQENRIIRVIREETHAEYKGDQQEDNTPYFLSDRLRSLL